MFLIEDGREQFYQWDSNRRLIIQDGSITQVHFCNRTDNCSLVVEVYVEGDKFYADVPNILLQTDWDIRVYAFDGNYTKFCKTFNVIARTKPADYVYTETEVLNYESLEAQINAIKEDIGVEIEAYMKENPVEVDLTGMATEKYVDEAIAAIDVPETDLSNYYTKQETNTAIAQAQPDLSGYAKKTDIPSTTGLATEKYVDDAIANIDIPEGEIVDEVYVGTEAPTDENVKIWIDTDDETEFATTGYVDEAVANAGGGGGKDWQWYSATGETTIPVTNVGSTNHIRVILTEPYSSNYVYTYDISTTGNNYFREEWSSCYAVTNLYSDSPRTLYFVNDGGNIRLCSYEEGAETDWLQQNWLSLVGFYYWA